MFVVDLDAPPNDPESKLSKALLPEELDFDATDERLDPGRDVPPFEPEGVNGREPPGVNVFREELGREPPRLVLLLLELPALLPAGVDDCDKRANTSCLGLGCVYCDGFC